MQRLWLVCSIFRDESSLNMATGMRACVAKLLYTKCLTFHANYSNFFNSQLTSGHLSGDGISPRAQSTSLILRESRRTKDCETVVGCKADDDDDNDGSIH